MIGIDPLVGERMTKSLAGEKELLVMEIKGKCLRTGPAAMFVPGSTKEEGGEAFEGCILYPKLPHRRYGDNRNDILVF